tara:strand:- start:991 stop:1359 length:369 start_codon:yes stop_codon:yes gene_type:complete
MPNLVGEDTVDTASTDGNCTYPAKKLGGTPTTSNTIKIEGQVLKTYDATSNPDDVDGTKINPLIPAPCQPGVRIITPTVNKTVFMDGTLPAVTGDEAAMFGTARPLTGPYQHANIIIGSRIT